MPALTRRQLMAGTAAAALAGIADAETQRASAQAPAHKSLSVGVARDIQGVMAPPYRTSFIENNVLRSVLQGLICFKPGVFEWELWAASRVQQVSDTVIEFELKPGLMFHGGYGEMTADDVKFSFELYGQPGIDGKPVPYATAWEALDHVEVTGRYAGRILLKSPAPQLWLVVLPDGDGLIISRKAWSEGAYRLDRQPVKVIGTGPYAFADWRPNEQVTLRASATFSGPKPTFEQILLRPVRDPKTAELALRADELQFTAIEPGSLSEVKRLARTDVIVQDSINYVWIGINVEKPPFDDVRVRQAIRLAIDVEQVIEGAYNGAVKPAYALMAPGLLGFWADAPRYRQDIPAARKLLAEAGHPTLKAKLTLLNRPVFQSIGEIVQAMLAEAGITLTLEVLDGGTYWSEGSGDAGRGLELSLQRFGGKADPSFQVQWFLSRQIGAWNWERWNSPEFDRLAAEAGSIGDAAHRNADYIRMQQLMDQSAAFIWLTHEANVFAFRDWLKPSITPNGDDLNFFQFTTA